MYSVTELMCTPILFRHSVNYTLGGNLFVSVSKQRFKFPLDGRRNMMSGFRFVKFKVSIKPRHQVDVSVSEIKIWLTYADLLIQLAAL